MTTAAALFGDRLQVAAERIIAAVERLLPVLTERANDEAHVSGLEARYYVRGALDPALTDQVSLGALLCYVLEGEADGCGFLTPASRARLAASLTRGWVEHRAGPPPEVLTWHRYVGGTHLQVVRGG